MDTFIPLLNDREIKDRGRAHDLHALAPEMEQRELCSKKGEALEESERQRTFESSLDQKRNEG